MTIPMLKKKINLMLLLLAILLLLMSCVGQDNKKNTLNTDQNNTTNENVLDATSPVTTTFTKTEIAYLEKLQAKGTITVATRPNKLTYYVEDKGVITGFHYELLKEFADEYNLNIKVIECGFIDYF